MKLAIAAPTELMIHYYMQSLPALLGSAVGPVLAVGLAVAAGGCSRPSLPSTSPAGIVDPRPVSAFGDPFQGMPPEPDGASFDPSEGLGVQGFADRRIGARVADFEVHHLVSSVFNGDLHFFYPAAGAGPGPGLCRTRVYSANGDPGPRPLGHWQGEVFAVAGSVAPLPRPWPAGYRERLGSACRARRDMGLWYTAPSADRAYAGARLADAVVASARGRGALPFDLGCRQLPLEEPAPTRCSGDVRGTIASANPRAIVRVEECSEEFRSPCLTVGIAQLPERGQSAAEDQWMLNIQYRGQDEPRIVRVDVDDARINFE